MVTVPKLWPNSTIVCVATGPSLTGDDVSLVCSKMLPVIVVNDAYRLLPADRKNEAVLYGCDEKWWRWQYKHHKDAIANFQGLRYSLKHHREKEPVVTQLRNTGETGLELHPSGLRTGRNSGYQAINLAVHLGAKRILLLGYDMSLGPGGKSHYFGEHPDRAKPPLTVFRRNFPSIAPPLKQLGIEVLNCSRRSALTCFPKVTLEIALPQRQVAA